MRRVSQCQLSCHRLRGSRSPRWGCRPLHHRMGRARSTSLPPHECLPGSAGPPRASVTLSPSFLLGQHHGPDARPSLWKWQPGVSPAHLAKKRGPPRAAESVLSPVPLGLGWEDTDLSGGSPKPNASPSPALRSAGSPFKISPDTLQFRFCLRTQDKKTRSILSGNSCQRPQNGCTAACPSVLLSFRLPCHILTKSVEGQDR